MSIILKLIFVISNVYHITYGTIDLNMQELQYLADHLHPEECRKLFASIHFHSYQIPDSLEQAENQVSKDIPCIRLLIHWNSAVGEGKGETHDVIEHRLRQMGRQDLADWLGRTVFHQLSQALKDSLHDPFHNMKGTEESIQNTTIEQTTVATEVTEWYPIDTIFLVVILILIKVLLIVVLRVACRNCCKRKKKTKKTQFVDKKSYTKLDSDSTDNESDEVFDIRSTK